MNEKFYKSIISGLLFGGLVISGCSSVNDKNPRTYGTSPSASGNGSSYLDLILESRNGSRVGKTARLYAHIISNNNVKDVKILEDCIVIKIPNNANYADPIDITKTSAEKHDYVLQASDKNGNSFRTSPITIEYSGIIEDRAPDNVGLGCTRGFKDRDEYSVGNTAELILSANDYGDNPGFRRAILYEDGKAIKDCTKYADLKSKNIESATVFVKEDFPRTHIYRFEVTDNGEHVVSSPVINIKFNP